MQVPFPAPNRLCFSVICISLSSFKRTQSTIVLCGKFQKSESLVGETCRGDREGGRGVKRMRPVLNTRPAGRGDTAPLPPPPPPPAHTHTHANPNTMKGRWCKHVSLKGSSATVLCWGWVTVTTN